MRCSFCQSFCKTLAKTSYIICAIDLETFIPIIWILHFLNSEGFHIYYAKYLVLYKLSSVWLFDDSCNFIELLLLLSVSSFLDHNVFSEQSDRFDSMSQHFPAQNNEIYDKK